MRDPDVLGAGIERGRDQLGPVGVIGDDQRQLDAALAHAALDAHPARGEGRHGVGEAARPAIVHGRRRAEDEGAGQLGGLHVGHGADIAEVDAETLVELAHGHHGTVQVDRRVIAGFACEADHALALAEAVGADQVGALRVAAERGDEAGDLARGGLVAEDGEGERCFRHEDVAGDELEGCAGGIGRALVVARDHRAPAVPFEHDLGRAQDVAGGNEADRDAADGARLSQLSALEAPGAVRAETQLHHLDGLSGGEHGAMAGARVIAVAMRDDRAGNGARGVDVDVRRLAVEAALGRVQPRVFSDSRHPALLDKNASQFGRRRKARRQASYGVCSREGERVLGGCGRIHRRLVPGDCCRPAAARAAAISRCHAGGMLESFRLEWKRGHASNWRVWIPAVHAERGSAIMPG